MQVAAGKKPVKTSASKALRNRDERRHSREDALSDREFKQFLDATHKMKDRQVPQARTALL